MTGCTPLIPPGCSPSREPAHRCKDRKKVVQAAEELRAHQRAMLFYPLDNERDVFYRKQ